MISLVGVRGSWSQAPIWIEAEGSAALIGSDRKKARLKALKAARSKAIAKAVAPEITAETLSVMQMAVGSIFGSIPYGKITTEEIIEEGLWKPPGNASFPGDAFYHISIKAAVIAEAIKGTPSFHINAAIRSDGKPINPSFFKEGDKLEIHIQSSKDCYLAIFNILEDQKITQLFPNSQITENLLVAGKTFIFRGNDDLVGLQMSLPNNKKKVKEAFYIIGLPHPFDLSQTGIKEGVVRKGKEKDFTKHLDEQQMTFLVGEIAGIPIQDRAECYIPYEIRKTRK